MVIQKKEIFTIWRYHSPFLKEWASISHHDCCRLYQGFLFPAIATSSSFLACHMIPTSRPERMSCKMSRHKYLPCANTSIQCNSLPKLILISMLSAKAEFFTTPAIKIKNIATGETSQAITSLTNFNSLTISLL